MIDFLNINVRPHVDQGMVYKIKVEEFRISQGQSCVGDGSEGLSKLEIKSDEQTSREEERPWKYNVKSEPKEGVSGEES